MESHKLTMLSEYLSQERLSHLKEENSSRYHCHGLFPYPAMMVPQLQGVLMDELLKMLPSKPSIYDPFMGSGTVLSESLSRGLNFYGADINPLSLLCCEVKSDKFDYKIACAYLDQLRSRLFCKSMPLKTPSFSGATKWFPENVLYILTHIRDQIKSIDLRWCRRIFWLALAECVRYFSRTRLSTYKLHIDKNYKFSTGSEIIHTFLNICKRNISLKRESWHALEENHLLTNDSPSSKVFLELTDAICVSSNFKVDLIMTSPPYGDNQTTVTYGQFSYLPLQFIDLNDIDQKFDRSILECANSIDSASLGGSLRFWRDKLFDVEDHSEELQNVIKRLRKVGRGGEKRLAAFTYDLHQALIGIAQRVRPGGFWMMTLGNRKINGIAIPLDKIVSEFLYALGFTRVAALNRTIGKKRMAGTMSTEKIVIMKKHITQLSG
jgi:hypothetical protein